MGHVTKPSGGWQAPYGRMRVLHPFFGRGHGYVPYASDILFLITL
jgi:hypothetical protein